MFYLLFGIQFVTPRVLLVVQLLLAVVLDATHVVFVQLVEHVSG